MSFDTLDGIFAARGWLSHQPAPFRRSFLALGSLVILNRGDPVFHIGDAPGGVFGIVSGAVSVLGATQWLMPVLCHVERSGEWFGHGPVLAGGARTLTFLAAEPSVLLHVPLPAMRRQMANDPDFPGRLAQMAEFGSRMVVAAARDLLIPDSTRRVAAVLLRVTAHGEVAAGHPDGYAISQSDLGEMASIPRYQVNRILADLQNRGWVTLGYSRIALRNVRALRGFAYAED